MKGFAVLAAAGDGFEQAAVADTEHYFYHSRGAMHTMTFNNMYSEGYLGDSAAKFVHYKVAHGATGIIFRNSALSATGVQLKIYKPAGYIYAAPIGWTNRMITYNGETLCLSDMADKYGVNRATVLFRLKSGKTIEQALSPIDGRTIRWNK